MPVARLGILVAALLVAVQSAAAADPASLRIAITPVLVENHLDLNRKLVAYLGEKAGMNATLVQRRSYKQVSDLLERSEVDVAFTCGLAYVIDHERLGVELLATPQVDEGPVYHAYTIVPADSPIRALDGLRGARFAFSDPLSNSGWLVPAHALARVGLTPEAFFGRTMFTYSHAASVEAVAVRFVDGASVDSYVYDALRKVRPGLVERTRIIARSSPHPFPPLVVRRGLPPEMKDRLRAVLLGMEHDARGRALLAEMGFVRFGLIDDRAFDGIRAMRRVVAEHYGDGRARPVAPAALR
jgi:phosphonate transport system substrate-binding protein